MSDESAEEPLIVGRRRDREDPVDAGQPSAHEIYGARDYVGAFMDSLWLILAPGGHLNIDFGTDSTQKIITIQLAKRMGLDLPTQVKMTWAREGELLRIKFTGDKPSGWFKWLFKPSVQIDEITVTKEEAVVALSGVLADWVVPDQKFVFKEGTGT